jgi:hypothetical protein
MTIVEIKNQLISHFYEQTVFDMETDGPKINLPEELNGSRREVISTVLADLASRGMVIRVDSPDKSIWLLTQSFDSFNQQIVIGAACAEAISETINDFRDANEIPGDLSDKTKITEADIMNLINIIYVLLDNEDQMLSEEEPEDIE